MLKENSKENQDFYLEMDAKSFNITVSGVTAVKNHREKDVFVLYFEHDPALEFNRNAAPFLAKLKAAEKCEKKM